MHPSEDSWLSVDFLDLPATPEVPDGVADYLQDGAALTAGNEPGLIPPQEALEPLPEALEPPEAGSAGAPDYALDVEDTGGLPEWEVGTGAAAEWIASTWRPWAAQWHRVAAVKGLHREPLRAA